MKIIITGVMGMVASHLAELCLDKGDTVYGTFRWQEGDENIQGFKDDKNFNLVSLNLNDLSNCIKVIDEIRPDAISHLAAESYVGDSFDHPSETIQTNTIGTLNLLEAVKIVKDRSGEDPVIHVCSSSEVYGLVTEDLIPIKEDCRFNPSNPYAVGKVGADMLALMYYTNYKLKTIRTRMFTHFSYRRKMKSAEVNFAEQIARIEAGLQEPILKHGNLNSVRTWADARDAVEAYYLLLTKPVKFGEVYNIGGNTTKTIGEMLDFMLDLSTEEIKVEEDPKLLRPYDVTLQIPDCTKFKTDYPEWRQKISFERSINDLLNAKRAKYA